MDTVKWNVEPHTGTATLPMLLHEITVYDWSLPLVGDYKGCVVAYVAGASWDDPEARKVAQANAELIASAPTLKAENERLKDLLMTIDESAAAGLGEWVAVTSDYVPENLIDFADIRDAIAEVLGGTFGSARAGS